MPERKNRTINKYINKDPCVQVSGCLTSNGASSETLSISVSPLSNKRRRAAFSLSWVDRKYDVGAFCGPDLCVLKGYYPYHTVYPCQTPAFSTGMYLY